MAFDQSLSQMLSKRCSGTRVVRGATSSYRTMKTRGIRNTSSLTQLLLPHQRC
jgi:hypothetical protein